MSNLQPSNTLDTIQQLVNYAEFKQVLDQILSATLAQKVRRLGVVSESIGEGKSFFILALTTAYAQLLQKRVLIVDTTNFAHPGSLDLSTALGATANGTSGLAKTKFDRIDLLKPVLRSEYEIDQVTAEYAGQYDLVIFDMPALSARNRRNVDPWIVARRCDANVLVLGRSSLNRGVLRDLQQQLNEREIKLIGVIANDKTRSPV